MKLFQRTQSHLLLLAFLLGVAFFDVFCSAANQLGKRTSELPLFATSVVHCDEMVTLHRWEGDCCSLNVTAGNGCILNVMNGYCKVYGQEWTLEYTSTYTEKDCPGSEYTPDMLGIKSVPQADEESGSSGNRGRAIFVGLLAGAMSVVLFG